MKTLLALPLFLLLVSCGVEEVVLHEHFFKVPNHKIEKSISSSFDLEKSVVWTKSEDFILIEYNDCPSKSCHYGCGFWCLDVYLFDYLVLIGKVDGAYIEEIYYSDTRKCDYFSYFQRRKVNESRFLAIADYLKASPFYCNEFEPNIYFTRDTTTNIQRFDGLRIGRGLDGDYFASTQACFNPNFELIPVWADLFDQYFPLPSGKVDIQKFARKDSNQVIVHVSLKPAFMYENIEFVEGSTVGHEVVKISNQDYLIQSIVKPDSSKRSSCKNPYWGGTINVDKYGVEVFEIAFNANLYRDLID